MNQQPNRPKRVYRIEGDSPREVPPSDIFDLMMLEENADKLNVVQDSPIGGRPDKRLFSKDLQKILKSSSSNENLIPEPRNDSSMDIESNKQFQTQNSQDDESVRDFKKRQEESFSIEYTSHREDSSESFSERSNSQNHRNSGHYYRMEEEQVPLEEPQKKQFQGCNCKRSKCIKLYCECFHLKIFCNQLCKCHSCANRKQNQAEHQKAIIQALSRNPEAFEQGPEVEQNPQRLQTANIFSLGVQKQDIRRGCKCKKSRCLKKYCDCYNQGQFCSIFCKCQTCENRPQPSFQTPKQRPRVPTLQPNLFKQQ